MPFNTKFQFPAATPTVRRGFSVIPVFCWIRKFFCFVILLLTVKRGQSLERITRFSIALFVYLSIVFWKESKQ